MKFCVNRVRKKERIRSAEGECRQETTLHVEKWRFASENLPNIYETIFHLNQFK